jgi:hypothetical protein
MPHRRKQNVVAELFLLSILYVLFEIYPGHIFNMHVINNRGIPLQSFNLQNADPLLWGKHFMTFYSCCILLKMFETRNAHYH